MQNDEFFRNATLRICGNLELDKALHDLLGYLSEFMPVTTIFGQKYEPGLNAMRTIAYATAQDYGASETLTPLSNSARPVASKHARDYAVFLISDPSSSAVASEMLSFHNAAARSIIVMSLQRQNEAMGNLVLISEFEPFTEDHRELMSLLLDPLIIAFSNVLKHQETLMLKDLLADDMQHIHQEIRRQSSEEIVGANFGLKNVMSKVEKVAKLDSPVLLLGETGVGKDVVANAIHYASPRYEKTMVKVNCGAIPESLIDSELFGYEKGAFTGALKTHKGKFERANGGTIFLDEIGELPLQAQTRLLRVLQDKVIERVGGEDPITLDIRIMAATNRDLEEMVATGDFREDLWYRMNVFPIEIPPLRDRPMDVPALVHYFLKKKSRELKLSRVPEIEPESLAPLSEYDWPGNVRELQNIIEREIILNPDGPINFRGARLKLNRSTPSGIMFGEEGFQSLDKMMVNHIKQALAKSNGQIHGENGAARLLRMNPNTLRSKIRKLSDMYDF